MLSLFPTCLMVEGDNCLIYEFYNVGKFLASWLVLAEAFINVEVVCGQSERKGRAAVSEPITIPRSQDEGSFETNLPDRSECNLFRIQEIPQRPAHFSLNTNDFGHLLHRQKQGE